MAHRILGLDLGHTALRLAVVDKTLRQATWTGYDEELLPADADAIAREAALRRLLERNQRPDDVIALGMPTAVALHRALTFPFRDDKAIAEAVGFELENHIPTPLADLVVDFVRTGEKDGQTEVLAIAVPRKDVESLLDDAKTVGLEVRRLGLQVLSYAALVRALPSLASGVTMLVDVGARSTEVAVLVDGRTQSFRSVAVGARSMAQTFASQFATDTAEADLLGSHAMLLPPGVTPETPEERLLHDATVSAVGPLLRELRLTLSLWLKRSHRRPDRVVLTGGAAGLRGLYDFLQAALGTPVVPMPLGELPHAKVAGAERLGDKASQALAQALAAGEVETDLDVDFRQGDLAFEGDFQVLRQRLPQLAVFVVLALCLLGIRTSLQYRALAIEQEQQLGQLAALTKQLTGKAVRDFDTASAELAKDDAVDMAALYPDLSAFRVMEELARIYDRVTEPPDYDPNAGKPAGGPADEAAPQGGGEQVDPAMAPPVRGVATRPPGLTTLGGRPVDAGALRNIRARMPSGALAGGDVDNAPGAPVAPPPPPGLAGPAPDAKAPAGSDGGAAGGGEPAAGDAGAPKPPGTGGHQLEFTAVQIERSRGTVRGEAETQDALLALQQAIDAHRCFGKAKSSSDRITFDRHRDWFKFTIEFEIACPADKKTSEADKDEASKDEEE